MFKRKKENHRNKWALCKWENGISIQAADCVSITVNMQSGRNSLQFAALTNELTNPCVSRNVLLALFFLAGPI